MRSSHVTGGEGAYMAGPLNGVWEQRQCGLRLLGTFCIATIAFTISKNCLASSRVKVCDGSSGLSGGVLGGAREDGWPFLIISFGAIIRNG